eukprot:TRINITY_DN52981_c0_g1_i1.p1 TRINITY_DN52981_c0_g1~~TRINITY_DN52981_c0_g1_i1.p1  ORF type:complete len:228 (+),score=45.83 TRINITY_DN52981_c0_g1_i1:75-758(+)
MAPFAMKLQGSMPVLLAILTVAASAPDPEPTAWPPVFHAVMRKNRSGQISHTDLFYDWPAGGNLHIDKTSGMPPFFDNERQNGSTYYYTPGGTCKVIEMGVGLLPPDWLKGGTYRGQASVRSPVSQAVRDCHVWEKGDAMGNFTGPFITYYEDIATHTPARWQFFDGMSFDIVDWMPGARATAEEWQIPESCFTRDVTMEPTAQELLEAHRWRFAVLGVPVGASVLV